MATIYFIWVVFYLRIHCCPLIESRPPVSLNRLLLIVSKKRTYMQRLIFMNVHECFLLICHFLLVLRLMIPILFYNFIDTVALSLNWWESHAFLRELIKHWFLKLFLYFYRNSSEVLRSRTFNIRNIIYSPASIWWCLFFRWILLNLTKL